MAKKIIVVYKEDGIINNIVDTLTMDPIGFRVTVNGDEYIIGYSNMCEYFPYVETPDYIIPGKYKYSAEGGFVENPNYTEPPKPLEVQLAESNERIALIEQAMQDLILGGV